MGWRSWNNYGCNISAPDIIAAATGLADTSRLVNGENKSLLSLGYSNVGLDDCWQELLVESCHYPGFGSPVPQARASACSDPNTYFNVSYDDQQCFGLAGPLNGVDTAAACAEACCSESTCEVWQFCAAGGCSGSVAPPNACYTGALGSCSPGPGWQSRGITLGYTFHDSNGNPVVNTTRFPDMREMTDAIHALGLSAGWYGNNCFVSYTGAPIFILSLPLLASCHVWCCCSLAVPRSLL
jgi:hypothetical protein